MNFRIARHTADLTRITEFYTSILNFEVLGSFENHDNYNGVFLGKRDLDWHLEFTTSDSEAQHSFDQDDLLVFYPTSRVEYYSILNNITQSGISIQKAKNPYWNENGIMIKDPDGYRIVISPLKVT